MIRKEWTLDLDIKQKKDVGKGIEGRVPNCACWLLVHGKHAEMAPFNAIPELLPHELSDCQSDATMSDIASVGRKDVLCP